MPGRLRTSFRHGNLAEHLGILLLKGVATVADVPRPEDVGVDAVANLLRFDDDGNCYAEDGFFVQLKSESESSVEYADHALNWLLAQPLPMFIGRLSLAEASIALYPTLHVNQAVLFLKRRHAVLHFGASPLPGGYTWGGRTSTDIVDVWLGEPVIEWTIRDLVDSEWRVTAYSILKRFLEIVRREYLLLTFGQTSKMEWNTNDANSIRASFFGMQGVGDLESNAKQCEACIKALLMHSCTLPEDKQPSLVIPLLAVIDALNNLGIDIDPKRVFSRFAIAFLECSQPKDNATPLSDETKE